MQKTVCRYLKSVARNLVLRFVLSKKNLPKVFEIKYIIRRHAQGPHSSFDSKNSRVTGFFSMRIETTITATLLVALATEKLTVVIFAMTENATRF